VSTHFYLLHRLQRTSVKLWSLAIGSPVLAIRSIALEMCQTMTSRLPVFLDAGHIWALINPNDPCHAIARVWAHRIGTERRRLVTTTGVITELVDGSYRSRIWARLKPVVEQILADPQIEVVDFNRALFDRALALRSKRLDKDWGLTDCASFLVMEERGMTEALACDSDFREAGYRALLLAKD
jgi:uncharacterized protein